MAGRCGSPICAPTSGLIGGNPETTTFSGVDMVPLIYRNQYVEVGGGLKASLNAHLSLFGNADYQFAVTSYRRDGVKGSLGLRYTW